MYNKIKTGIFAYNHKTKKMGTKTFSDFRANLKFILDNTADSYEPLIVKRQQGEDVIVMSLSDYNAHKETISLLSNPANAIKRCNRCREICL